MQWKVRFQDYVKFNGVKDSINNVKRVAKAQKKAKNGMRMGDLLEESIKAVIEKAGIIEVGRLQPQYDMGFGADFKFHYLKGGRNHSFFVDVTSKRNNYMRYFGIKGDLVDGINDAFCYYTDEFKVYFSIKYNHHGFFYYEKPVITMVVQEFGKSIDPESVELSHSININNILIALHEFLCTQGYGIRASHYVYPNVHRFKEDYLAHKQ